MRKSRPKALQGKISGNMKSDRRSNNPDPAQQEFHATATALSTANAFLEVVESLARVARVHEYHWP
jgi:hypothetical protein